MSNITTQEQEIVDVFSNVEIPEKVIKDSNIRDLVKGMSAEQERLRQHSLDLDRTRQEREEGNFFGNFFYGRDDKVQEANLDLSTAVGKLTEKSSQLLIINTALSKVLSNQQSILLKQQVVLEQQTTHIRLQNEKIQDFQYQVAAQTRHTNEAQKNLDDAAGLLHGKVDALINSVSRAVQAEQNISTICESFKSSVLDAVTLRTTTTSEHYREHIELIEKNQSDQQNKLNDFQNQVRIELITQRKQLIEDKDKLDRLKAGVMESDRTIAEQQTRLLQLAQLQHKNTIDQRIIMAIVGSLVFLSFFLHVAQRIF